MVAAQNNIDQSCWLAALLPWAATSATYTIPLLCLYVVNTGIIKKWASGSLSGKDLKILSISYNLFPYKQCLSDACT